VTTPHAGVPASVEAFCVCWILVTFFPVLEIRAACSDQFAIRSRVQEGIMDGLAETLSASQYFSSLLN
jgi:hypothetical protein